MVNALLNSGLWGHTFRDPQTAALFDAPNMLRHMVAFERAWTLALIESGEVGSQAGDAALARLDGFAPDLAGLGHGADQDGLPVPALVRQLREGLTPEARKAIHTRSTSQDVIDTAMVLALREMLDIFVPRIANILKRLDVLRDSFGDVEMMGRTRMQAALPVSVAHRIDQWDSPLRRIGAQAHDRKQALGFVQVGGPVGSDTEMAARVAVTLGLQGGPVWHSDRSVMTDTGHWLAVLTGALGKMGQDIALMAQQGIDEIVLKGAGGSSAMPHKQNPIAAETLVTLGRFTAGQQGILGQAMIHEQERSGSAWALEWMVLPVMAEAAGCALMTAQRLLDQITRLGPQQD